MTQHTESKHKGKYFVCKECDKKFSCKANMKVQMKAMKAILGYGHKGSKRYKNEDDQPPFWPDSEAWLTFRRSVQKRPRGSSRNP